MAKLPYDDLQAMQELVEKVNKTQQPTRPDFDSNELEDVGYEPPTQNQINSPGFQAASNYLKNSNPIVGTKAAELLGAYKAQEASRMPTTEESGLTLESNPETTETQKPSMQEQLSLLEKYKKLTENRQLADRNLNLLQGGNQIAQAIASGYGGRIGDGSETVNQLRKSAELPIQDFLSQGKTVDLENDLQMSDPNSDISKFARERAIASATKMGIPVESVAKLEKMSAKQLEKLGLYKNDPLAQGSKLGLYYTTIRDDKTGQDRVVGIDRQTGQIVQDIGGKTYSDKIIENKQTGQNEIYRQGKGVDRLDKSTTATSEEAAKKQAETKAEYTSPTVLNKVNPNLYKDFKKTQDEFNKDMKDSREVATSVTNLAAKLKPGQNMKIDSGLLGGIQTQAAKMAGQKGVLTDQDLVKFAGAGGVSAAIDRFFSGNFDGEMSEQDVQFFKAFAKKMEQSLAEDITNRSKLYTGQILNESKDYLPGLNEADVQKWLNVEQVAPAVQNKQVLSTGKIQIQDSNGKTHVIRADKLEEAKQRDPGLKVLGQ